MHKHAPFPGVVLLKSFLGGGTAPVHTSTLTLPRKEYPLPHDTPYNVTNWVPPSPLAGYFKRWSGPYAIMSAVLATGDAAVLYLISCCVQDLASEWLALAVH